MNICEAITGLISKLSDADLVLELESLRDLERTPFQDFVLGMLLGELADRTVNGGDRSVLDKVDMDCFDLIPAKQN